ncbi:hypothetical protein FPV67DRAFT_1663764 [Lyophyllum atratum]|nr:hypothetical protein FPV67DRAFT_1663764 [Lyophyllum atratum]
MSSYPYTVPASPTYGFFPTGTTSPNAFASLHQSPRDSHAMYAAFGASSSNSQQQRGNSQSQSSSGLKKFMTRKTTHCSYSFPILHDITTYHTTLARYVLIREEYWES